MRFSATMTGDPATGEDVEPATLLYSSLKFNSRVVAIRGDEEELAHSPAHDRHDFRPRQDCCSGDRVIVMAVLKRRLRLPANISSEKK